MRDPYEVLGVPREASPANIKSAFRKLAKKLHPDANKSDPKTAARFSELNLLADLIRARAEDDDHFIDLRASEMVQNVLQQRLVADLEPVRCQDVILGAVCIMQQGDIGRAIGIVLERCDYRRNPIARALEVDHAQTPLVAAAAMAHGHAAAIVAAAGFLDRLQQRFLRRLPSQFREVGDLHEALAGRARIQLNYCHLTSPREQAS